MADPASESWVTWALGGLATFLGGMIVWDRNRAAVIQDRDFASRENYTRELAKVPGALDKVSDKVTELSRRLDETEARATRAETLVLALERRFAERGP